MQFEVDERTASRAGRIVKDLIKDSSQLNETLGRVNVGSAAASAAGVRLPGSTAGQRTAQVQQSGASGPMGGLTKALTENRDLLRSMGTLSKDSLRAMSEAVRDGVDRQVREVSRLRRELDALTRGYQALNEAAAPIREAGMPALSAAMGDKMTQLAGARRSLDTQRNARESINAELGARAAGPGRPPELEKQNDGLGSAIGAVVKTIIGKVVLNAVAASAEEGVKAPWDMMGRYARQGGAYGQTALAVKRGDLRTMAAMEFISRDEHFRRDFLKIATGNDRTLTPERTQGDEGGLRGWATSGARRTMSVLGNLHIGNPVKQWDETIRGIDNIPVDQRMELLAMANKHIEAFPGWYQVYDQLQSNYRGDISAMRGLGSGAGRIDPVTGQRINYGLRTFRSFSNSGFDRGEVLGVNAAIEQMAGLRTAHQLLGQGVFGQAAHIYSAPQLLGAAALAGGVEKSRDTMWNLRSMIGLRTGGMDVAAANRMAQTVTGGLMDQAAMTTGGGYMGALGVFGRGDSASEDMRIQMGMAGGSGSLGNLVRGAIDPYQQGRNLLAAIHAMPQGSVFSQEYMATRMTPRLMADILGNRATKEEDRVPFEMRARGIGFKNVQDYWSSVERSIFDRNIRATSAQGGVLNPQQQLAQQIIGSGGGFKQWFLGERARRLKGGASAADMGRWSNETFKTFGTMLFDEGLADSEQSAEGMARLLGGLGANAAVGRPKGRGGGDAAAGSTEMRLNRKTSGFEGEQERKREALASGIEAKIESMAGWVETLNDAGATLTPVVDRLAKDLLGLAEVIEKVENRLAPRKITTNHWPITVVPSTPKVVPKR